MEKLENIKTISVIGAGTLGKGIAQILLLAGFERVVLNDLNMNILRNSAEEIKKSMDSLTTKKKLKKMIESDVSLDFIYQGRDPEDLLKDEDRLGELARGSSLDDLMKRLVLEDNLQKAVANSDYVIEAVFENLELKQEVFKKLNQYCPQHATIATNSSSISISKIAENSGRPDKVIGMHFFFPYITKLIEITPGDKTSPESIKIGEMIGKRLPCFNGKRVIVTLNKESPGFIANRVFAACSIYNSRILDYAAEKGIRWEQLDADMASILPLGWCQIMDMIGIDIVYDVLKYLETALSPDFKPGTVLSDLYEKGHLGKKTMKGFYEWNEDGSLKSNIDYSQPAGIYNLDMLYAIQLNEACRVLEEGVVKSYRIIDKAIVNSYAVPGPFMKGRRIYPEWVELLEKFHVETGIQYLKPCELMKSGEFLNFKG